MTVVLLSPRRRQEDGELARWIGSFGLVLGLHGAVVLGTFAWKGTEAPHMPPAALMLELAPLPTSPAETSAEIPPGPRQVEAAPPPPPEPEPEPVPEKIEPPPAVDKPAVALPPPPKPKRKPRPPRREVPPQPVREPIPEPTPPAPATTAPQAAPTRSPVAAAPVRAAPSPMPSDAMPTWLGVLRGHLERHKRYPRSAQRRRQQGTAYLRFTMDRTGRVLKYRLERSAGVSALDAETLALIQRAQPLPPPPPDMPGETLELIVPVQFLMQE